jgi:hypothetical protein
MKKIKQNEPMGYFILFVLMLVPGWLKPSDSFLLRLPVHIARVPGPVQLDSLEKNDLMLFINGSQRKIDHLQTQTWNINKTSDLSRHFVLSFHMDGFDRKVMEGVGYFIDNILDRADSLTVLTPIGSYQVKLDKGKAAVYDVVEKLLEKDGSDYRKKRAALVGEIQKEIAPINRLFGEDAYLYNPGPVFYNFFTFCQQAMAEFKLHFLAPFVLQDQVVKELPQKGEGEIWWLHFQHRAFEPIPSPLRNMLNRLVTLQNASGISAARSYEFAQLLKQMPIAPQFPLLPLLEKVQEEKICYNVIFWGTGDNPSSTSPQFVSSGLENSLAQIARSSGGTIVQAILPSQGLIKLQQHENRFYEVVFPLHESGQPLDIHLAMADQRQNRTIRLNYPHRFETERIQTLLKESSGEKVKIIDFNLEGNQVSFAVTDFHDHAPDLLGLVKVRAELYKEQQVYTPVFRTGNTLHAACKKIHISLPLPSIYTGRFKLRVSVCDLITNQLDIVERRVRL